MTNFKLNFDNAAISKDELMALLASKGIEIKTAKPKVVDRLQYDENGLAGFLVNITAAKNGSVQIFPNKKNPAPHDFDTVGRSRNRWFFYESRGRQNFNETHFCNARHGTSVYYIFYSTEWNNRFLRTVDRCF